MADDSEPLGIIELDSNLGDVEKPPILPTGRYSGEIVDVQREISGKGNSYFQIGIKIPPSEIPAHLQEDFEEGATMYWNRQLVPDGKDRRTLYNLRKMVEAFGLSSAVTAIDPNEWMGCQVGVVIKHSAYQGEQRAEIGALYSLDGGVAASPPPKTKAATSRSRK